MPAKPGQILSHYRIVEKIGEGGMGSVWKAVDTRLDRPVALKVLPERVSGDPKALARFEREARAVAALSHPHILAVHDLGSDDGVRFVVMELLEGETLKQRLAEGALPLRKTVEFAGQIARGLAAAHDKGIVHRDLKPDNVFVTTDGQVKILDFGLAKLDPVRTGTTSGSEVATMTRHTDPGVVLGTVGYMSPEQVRGQEADARSDIFSLGVVLFEMVTGKRAFSGDSSVETMNAILKEEPAELQEISREVSPAVERIIRHCLEKRPEERFQSARDVAFDLEAHTDPSSSGAVEALDAAVPRPRFRKLVWTAAAVVLAGSGLLVGLLLGGRGRHDELPRFERITYRQGTVWSARFGADGETVFYSASWDGGPMQLFVKRPGETGSANLDLGEANLLSVSPSGELAIATRQEEVAPWLFLFKGTLSRADASSNVARELAEQVHHAEWSPDGTQLAVVREVDGVRRLEFPPGVTLHETPGHIRNPRFSPEGNLIAFIDHPILRNDRGFIVVTDLEGNTERLSEAWDPLLTLAWSPSGDEVWFTSPHTNDLMGVTLEGRLRVVASFPGGMLLHDVARTGAALVSRFDRRAGILGVGPGETRERELSRRNSWAVGISSDGTRLLFSDQWRGDYAAMLRRLDGSNPVRLLEGQGSPAYLSLDGKWAVVVPDDATVFFVPTGAGETRTVSMEGFEDYSGGGLFPDNERYWVTASKDGQPPRSYVFSWEGELLGPLAAEGHRVFMVSPDGEWLAARCPDGPELHAVSGDETRPIPGLRHDDRVLQWSTDGRSLFVAPEAPSPAIKVFLLDLETGQRTVWKEIAPDYRAGTTGVSPPVVNPDGTAYAYNYGRILSELYVVEGLR